MTEETQALERYKWGVNIDAGTAYEKMQRAKSGEWVRYEDAAAEIARLTRERDEARRSRYQTHVYGCRLDGDERTGPCADCDEATKRYDPKGTP